VLRVHDPAAEALGALECRCVALVVAVVAGAREQEVAGQARRLLGVGALDIDRPSRIVRRPLGAHDAMAEVDLSVDAVVTRRVPDVAEYRGPVRDRLGVLPWPEGVAERVHVRVRPDPGVPEQIPRAADGVSRLEDGEGLARALGLEVAAGADARKAGADDQHVKVFDRLGTRERARRLRGGIGRRLDERHPINRPLKLPTYC
jgi:hypothetical protein